MSAKSTSKARLLNALLILTSLFGYLEWGGGMHSFLFQAEAEIFSKVFSDPASVLHPLTLLPVAGQLLLFITLFQKTPGKILTYAGLAGIGILLIVVFIIGALTFNFKLIGSTIPFLVVAVMTIRYYRRIKAFPDSSSLP